MIFEKGFYSTTLCEVECDSIEILAEAKVEKKTGKESKIKRDNCMRVNLTGGM